MDKSTVNSLDEIYKIAFYKSKVKKVKSSKFKKRKKFSKINWLTIFLIIILILIIILLSLLIYFISISPNSSYPNTKKNKSLNINQSFYKLDNNNGILKNAKINITHLNYSYSLKYNISEVEYYISFYDEFNNSIIPSKLLFYNWHVICHMRNEENNIIYDSFANIYEDKYFYCIEYFNISEKLTFGVKLFTSNSLSNNNYKYNYNYNYINNGNYEYFFFDYNKFNFNDINYKNDSKFNPLLINQEFSTLENKIISLNNSIEQLMNETLSLKQSYIIKPICSPMTSPTFLNNSWTFINIYNHYFYFCNGKDCYMKSKFSTTQLYKYKFYLSIIDNNRYVYNKTHYILSDFFYSGYSYDDAYPIFEEMLRRNMSAHYLTQTRIIFTKHCSYNIFCQVIIRDIYINGDFLEKYLELILRLKAIIVGSSIFSMDYMFYNIEYVTAINLGHGVKYFKSFLYRGYTNHRMYNKLLLVPSKKIINVALKYGWKEENIIKICLPKWDKYDNYKKENNDIEKSIFLFFTWREIKKGKTISNDYINNILKIVNNEALIQKLIEKNIILYHRLHPSIRNIRYKFNIKNSKVKYINIDKISDTLMKSNLLITDFSSVYFDFVYQRKPAIIYIPDSDDPNNKDNYNDDYYNLINSMKNGEIHIENKCNSTEEVIDKIINYIDNNFELEPKLKEFYDSFKLKCGNNIQSFINYLENLK